MDQKGKLNLPPDHLSAMFI